MSHSKMQKRGYSLYVEEWNPNVKKYINECGVCGRKGYSPVIEEEGFCDEHIRRIAYQELKKTLTKLELDEYGRCATCARLQDKK